MLSSPSTSFRNIFKPSQSLLSPFQTSIAIYYHTVDAKTPKSRSRFTPRNPKPQPNPSETEFSTASISVSHLDENTVRETLFCYSNDWKRAFEFFNWVETDCGFSHTAETYNSIIDILGKFFEFDLAWDLINRRRNRNSGRPFPDHATFRVLFKRYVSARLVREAVATYDRLGEFNMKNETSFLNLVDALCEYKHVIEAEVLCLGKNRITGFKQSTKIYNMILRGWFKMGWWSKCREFWEKMDKRGIVKDLHSYSIYMDILCKSGKPWKAVKLYKEMRRKGMKLDIVAYNTVIRAIGLSEGVDFSIRVFREMKDLGCEPNVVTHNTIIKLLCENGRFKEAYDALDEMPKKGCEPDVLTFQCFFGCLEKPREILRLFDRMIGSGVRPRLDTYVMLMRKFGRWGFLRPVFLVWKKMEEHRCSPNESAYSALIDALVQKGMTDIARKYDQEMLAKGLSAKSRLELGKNLLCEGPDDMSEIR